MSVAMKFGGTSVADPDAMGRLIEIVRHQMPLAGSPAPVVVVSALAGVTDTLVETVRLAGEGEGERTAAGLHALLARHLAVATAMTTDSRATLVAAIGREFDELIGLVDRMEVLDDVSRLVRLVT